MCSADGKKSILVGHDPSDFVLQLLLRFFGGGQEQARLSFVYATLWWKRWGGEGFLHELVPIHKKCQSHILHQKISPFQRTRQ